MKKPAVKSPQPVNHAVMNPETPAEFIAHWISNIFSPPIAGLAVLTVASLQQPTSKVWLWVGIYILFALLIPFGFLLWQLKKGAVSDIEVYHREQRSGSLLVSSGGFALAGIALTLIHAPVIYLMMAAMGLLIWLSIYLITLRWKISVHSTSATAGTLIIVYILGWHMSPLLLIIPAIAWARVRLRKHTPWQTMGGILLATGIFAIVLAGIWLLS